LKTYSAKAGDVEHKWYVMDATDVPLGRLATRIATVLRGKHKPMFTPHMDTGDHVVVLNASGVKLTGRKLDQKTYERFSGYPGGRRTWTAREMLEKRPEDIITLAVRGMLPKNRLGRQMIKKLKVYAGGEHPHSAQKPEPLEL
jgi:large subunit ribosomal protein L13